MDSSDDRPGAASDQVVERGETYTHDTYGSVEVMGIWKGVDQVDKAHHSNEKDVYIVRFAADQEGDRVSELTDTLGEFIRAVE